MGTGRQPARRAAATDRTGDRDLQSIPGVGPSIARDLRELGYRRVEDLAGEDPRAMYEALGGLRGTTMDRCVLYVFRCAVYFAGTSSPEPELLKWWNWKDRETTP